jgi:hypothetical protein
VREFWAIRTEISAMASFTTRTASGAVTCLAIPGAAHLSKTEMNMAETYEQLERERNMLSNAHHALAERLEAAHRAMALLQVELGRWQDNCTGRHGSQTPCGLASETGEERE